MYKHYVNGGGDGVVIDGYRPRRVVAAITVVDAAVCGRGARAGIDVYGIKTYGQQVEDQHVWYLSRRFIWILALHKCELYHLYR